MKLDSFIRTYGREVMESLRECHDEDTVRQVLGAAGFEVTDKELNDIVALVAMLNGGVRELTLDELSQITGG
ncbi:MAG: hypothetical protein ACI3Y0_10715 [Prevotella sp.]